MGRRPELVGCGLIRSLGGWSEVKKLRLKGMDRIKGDERILGDSDFVMSVLSKADEQFERRYELKRLGYDMSRVADTVVRIYSIEKDVLFQKGRQSCVQMPGAILLLVLCRVGASPDRACPGTGDDRLGGRICRSKRRKNSQAT